MSASGTPRLALLALVALSLIWGYNWVVMKQVIQYVDPFDFSAIRTVLGAATLFIVLLVLRKPMSLVAVRQVVLYGSGRQTIPFAYVNERGRTVVKEHTFEGVVNNLQRRYRETDSMAVKEELAKFINEKKCPACEGARLRTEARFVKIGQGEQQRAIYEVSDKPLRETLDYFDKLEPLQHELNDLARWLAQEMGGFDPAYPIGDSLHAQVSMINIYGGNQVWDAASFVGELAFNRAQDLWSGA